MAENQNNNEDVKTTENTENVETTENTENVEITEEEIVPADEELPTVEEDIEEEIISEEHIEEEEHEYFVYYVSELGKIVFVNDYTTKSEAHALVEENNVNKISLLSLLPHSSFGHYALVNNTIVEDVDANIIEEQKLLTEKLRELIEEKQDSAEVLISGKEIDDKKRERYKRRARHCRNITGRNTQKLEQIAKLQNTTTEALIGKSIEIIKPLADFAGLSVKDYAERVVLTEKLWMEALDTFYGLLDTFENKVSSRLEEKKFTSVKQLLEQGEEIGVSKVPKTPQEILALAKEQVEYLVTNF